jgi:hypothetical protein
VWAARRVEALVVRGLGFGRGAALRQNRAEHPSAQQKRAILFIGVVCN